MRFYWLPLNEKSLHLEILERANLQDKILPFLDNKPAFENVDMGLHCMPGHWSEIHEGDELWIFAHGHRYSSNVVSWKVGDRLVTWSPQQLTSSLISLLQCKHIYSHQYILSSCFGANRFFFSKSFGGQLAQEMRRSGFKGRLTALKGATGMYSMRGLQSGNGRMSHRINTLSGNYLGTSSETLEKTWQLNS